MRLLDGDIVLSPSDLTKFTRCAHATTLDLSNLLGTLDKYAEKRKSLHTDFIVRKGNEHEHDYIERLARAGNRVITISGARATRQDLRDAEEETLAAMRAGSDSIYQAVFFDGQWAGYADLLQKVPTPSDLGDWSYEVVDTKLARSPKAHFILQLASYSEQLARVQGLKPAKMHVVLGTRERVSFRVADFEAYYRYIKRRFEERIADALVNNTAPYIVEFCALCEWNLHCWRHLEKLDHLVRVANIRRDHVRRLEAHGITTLTKLGETPDAHIEKIRNDAYATLHHQARLQAAHKRTGEHRFELLTPEAGRGFELLPKPSPGDVFLDLEADPYAGEGITYLFGIATPDKQYHAWWAEDALQQKNAFEEVIDFINERRRAHPDMHIYHYTAAEPSALKRMSAEFGTRENEIDDYLRQHVFTDLYTIVRQAMRISQPKYSLKKLEAFYFKREEEGVFERGGPILAYEEWLESRDPAIRTSIENYNREDCVSTVELRDWLLTIRPEDTKWYDEPPAEQTQDAIEAEMQIDALAQALLAGVPPDLIDANEDEKARWLLANLLYYHRREARPQWWWYHERRQKSPEELIEDTEAIGGLQLATDIPPRKEKRSKIHTFRFPPQQYKLVDQGVDPETERTVQIIRIDEAAGLIEIKLGDKADMPAALIPPKPIPDKTIRNAVKRVARQLLQRESSAAIDILYRKPVADSRYLFVQGPPGAGKTYYGAHEIVKLLAEGKRVGVASNSHKAIHNLLDNVEKYATAPYRGLKKSTADEGTEYDSRHIASSETIDDFLDPEINLIAGTAWLFANEKLEDTLDVVFIDEAGQVSLANALAIATSARRVILLGDPLQLAQVSQAPHPGTSGASVLEHLLGSDATIPPERGLFLDKTHRMHPDVCAFVSEVVYDGRLKSAPECAAQRVIPHGTGLRFIGVEHTGNSTESIEEANRVADEIADLLTGSVTQKDIMVVAPYNAQVRRVSEVLKKRGFGDVPVGTVDKFQGREAQVVFFTMATSSGDDLPRDIDFLFSRNRLNVAISRARCIAYVVASPRLLDVACRTPEQMQLVNALCRFVEMAAAL